MRLPICSPGLLMRTYSANEVAQIINRKNNSLKEGVRFGGLKQNAKSN
jgi:nitrogenase subunit NifH